MKKITIILTILLILISSNLYATPSSRAKITKILYQQTSTKHVFVYLQVLDGSKVSGWYSLGNVSDDECKTNLSMALTAYQHGWAIFFSAPGTYARVNEFMLAL